VKTGRGFFVAEKQRLLLLFKTLFGVLFAALFGLNGALFELLGLLGGIFDGVWQL